MKSKLEMYALSICFVAVVSLVISISIVGYSIFRVVTPELTMHSYDYNKHQTNDAFWKSNEDTCGERNMTEVKPSEDVLTKQRLESFSIEVKAEKREGLQAIIGSILFIFISSLTLFIHWKITRKAREV